MVLSGLSALFLNQKIQMMKTIIKNCIRIIAVLSFLLMLPSCNSHQAKNDETPTRGNIKISVDESFSLLIDSEVYTFQALYQNAHVTPQYKPDVDVINDLLNDSVRTVVTTSTLSQTELDYLKTIQIYPRTVIIAHDALAFIVNKKNTDTLLKSTTIKGLFTGEISNWNQINQKNKLGEIKVVFDNKKSGNVNYFKEKFKLDTSLLKNISAAQTNEEVISYVEKNPNAIGILSVNWISDRRDSITQTFLSRFKVVAISPEFDPDGGYYYQPYQAYIADKSYPYIRDVYMISRETFTGLGSGFMQFVAGEKGQRIILKAKLVPSTMPIRLVEIKK
jgi:phosphate transport system substrate-binding protein